MLLSRVLSAFKKNNIEVIYSGREMVAVGSKNRLSFYENGSGSGHVTHFTLRSPETKAEYDCFCDSYFHTIKSAILMLNGGTFG